MMKILIENAKQKAISSIKEDIEDGDLIVDSISLIRAMELSTGKTNINVIKNIINGNILLDIYKTYCIVKVLDKSKNRIVEINLDSTGDWNGKTYNGYIYLWGDKIKI